MSTTTQLNLRVPTDIKTKAQDKAEKIGTNLNFLIKIFLSKFVVEDDLVIIKQDIHMDKVFDKGTKQYLSSGAAKKRTKKINSYLEDIIKDEKKYIK
ncbi:hypothetical protein P148_SR1C00001G0564 [candidate division SR1 bacterium RAAC1_SR1_1]|nr:hypothetical protein P148_SR1C00001G0564 [candidate division SR1 bacterium RAAC1_SR1_1]